MDNIVVFLEENMITVLISIIVAVTMSASWMFSKKKTNIKVSTEKRCQLTNKDYTICCKNSENSIVNTTVTFGPKLCSDKNEIDDLYSRTVVVGNKMLREDGFRISVVQKV